MNKPEFTPYNITIEQLNSYTKEELVNNIMHFTNTVNQQFHSLIAFYSQQSNKDDQKVDVDSEDYISMFNREKTTFEGLGVTPSSFKLLKKKLTSAISERSRNIALLESSQCEVNKCNMKVHVLSSLEEKFRKCINQRQEIDEQKTELRTAQIALKKQAQQLRASSSSISIDDDQPIRHIRHRKRIIIDDDDDELLDFGTVPSRPSRSRSEYINSIDEFISDI
jgi:hypothetical protein